MDEPVLSHERSRKQKGGQGSGCRTGRRLWTEALRVLEPAHERYSLVMQDMPGEGGRGGVKSESKINGPAKWEERDLP